MKNKQENKSRINIKSDLSDIKTMPKEEFEDTNRAIQSNTTMSLIIKKQIELTVDSHPSGNLTLKEQTPEMPLPSDCHDPRLFTNDDVADFYRATCERIASHSQSGYEVIFIDTISQDRLTGK